jgi:hypothetical protein
MASPTPAEIREAQSTQINTLLRNLSEAQATAAVKITSREDGRATVITTKEKAIEKKVVPPEVLAKLEGFIAAFDETISLARAHESIMDEMEDKVEAQWKKVKKGAGGLEKRQEVIEKWTKEYEKVKTTYEEAVIKVFKDAGLESDGNQ